MTGYLYLVRGTPELVDDANVRHPCDREWHVEIDDAGGQTVRRHRFRIADKLSGPNTDELVRPDEYRNVECHVVNPHADDNSHGNAHFKSGSAHLLHSQKSTEQ